MGTTLLGIDLDESPVGGLIETLLSEEDLEKLTDGGRKSDEHADASDGDSDEPSADDTDDGSRGTDVDASDDSAADTEAAESGTDIVDDAVGSEDDADSTTVPVGTSDETSDAPWDTGGPSAAATGLSEQAPTPEATTADEFESESDDERDWTAKLRPLLLKATLALTVLAVIALVLYRYLDTAKDVAGDKLPTDRFGGDDDDADAASPSDDDEVSPARRRAKATGRDETDDSTDADRREVALHADDYSSRPVDEAVHGAEETTDGRTATGDRAERSRPETDDSDVGALVGLAALALVAAVVRKFGEDRPRDPLVDGPADEHGDE